MRGNGAGREQPPGLPDDALWQRSRIADAVEQESERLLDLAGFAEGRLDEDDRERVAEWLARDPDAAADIAAAQALAAAMPAETAPEHIVERAAALVAGSNATGSDNVVPFRPKPSQGLRLGGVARWGSLAAAIAVASWLGFTLGMDTSLSLSR